MINDKGVDRNCIRGMLRYSVIRTLSTAQVLRIAEELSEGTHDAVPQSYSNSIKHSDAFEVGKHPGGLLDMPESLHASIAKALKGYPRAYLKPDAMRLSEVYKLSCAVNANEILHPRRNSNNDLINESVKHAPLDFGEREAMAFVASQMPFSYSIAERVLREVEVRCPEFEPVDVLDFGSGTGSALW